MYKLTKILNEIKIVGGKPLYAVLKDKKFNYYHLYDNSKLEGWELGGQIVGDNFIIKHSQYGQTNFDKYIKVNGNERIIPIKLINIIVPKSKKF